MDLGLSRDMFDSFMKYQTLMQKTFRRLQTIYGFTIVDGMRPAEAINAELQKKISAVLGRTNVNATPASPSPGATAGRTRSMAEQSNKQEYIVGVDLGGTKILAGVFKHSLEMRRHRQAQHQVPARRGRGHRAHRPLRPGRGGRGRPQPQAGAPAWASARRARWISPPARSSSPPIWRAGKMCRSRRTLEKHLERARLRGERLQHLPPWASMSPNSKPSPSTWSASSSAPALAAG